MPPRLTKRREQVLAFIRDHAARTGAPPTVREIAAGLGIPSPNAVVGHLAALQRMGVIERSPRRARGIRTVSALPPLSLPIPEVVPGIPILGRIAAGRPIYADENVEGTIAADPFLVRDRAETFVLRVQGDSMSGDAILPGDYIFVRRQPVAERGQIVVALIDDEATVKRYFPEPRRVRLVASNPAYAPIVIRQEDGRRFEVLGVVTGVFRRV
ncbi:MAG: transcriptional repressor LexA [Deltaproteobacteria bacterium]|nr:transcriptional repressor LexA [Deltaproteobacteria bacterium]